MLELTTAVLMIAISPTDSHVENARADTGYFSVEDCRVDAHDFNHLAIQQGEETYYFCMENNS